MEPWHARLAEGDSEAAWGLFIDQYRRLIIATIRRTVDDAESVMDGFAHVCGQLSADALARLQRYDHDRTPRARFSTWLVAVVHNLTIDWLRSRDRRHRVSAPDGFSAVQELIFRCVFVERRSHVEAYEVVCATSGELTFGVFLKELAEAYRVVENARARGAMHYLAAPAEPGECVQPIAERRVARAEIEARLREALAALPPDESLAVQLYVVEELPAADVAKVLDWPNAKAVYNRIYRALTRVRRVLDRQGIGPADL